MGFHPFIEDRRNPALGVSDRGKRVGDRGKRVGVSACRRVGVHAELGRFSRTVNGEQRTRNGERRTANGERGTLSAER